MKVAVVSTIALGTSVLAYYFIKHTGLTTKVVPVFDSFPQKRCAFYTFVGDYPAAWKDYMNFTKKLDTLYGRNNMVYNPSFGIYYDNPETVPVNQRRSIIGQFLPDGLEFKDNEYGIRFGVVDAIEESLQYKYPYHSTLTMLCGLKRIYPKIIQYVKDHKDNWSDFMEVYGLDGRYEMMILSGKNVKSGLLVKYPE